MRNFDYSIIAKQKWDSEILGYIALIYKYAGKQELYLKIKPDELEKLVEIAKISKQDIRELCLRPVSCYNKKQEKFL